MPEQNAITRYAKDLGKTALRWLLPKKKEHRIMLYAMTAMIVGILLFG